jgi:protein ImuB
VLFASHNQRPVITVCSLKAQRLGLHAGQPLAEAKALLPRAVFIPADDAADRDALCQLALDAQRFSPLVGLEEGDNPESLLHEVSGCTHLWKGEKQFLEAVRDYWGSRGYHVQLALAGTVGAAWALAHTTTSALVLPGDEQTALSPLPVAALRLPIDTLERLDALGLHTIGAVVQLPRETLASRFGVILPQRLDQALGYLSESFVCERLREPLESWREWEVPIDDRFDIACVCRQMISELVAMAQRHGMALSELEGELRTEAGLCTIEIKVLEPTRDASHLAQLAELQLERQKWSGGVVAIRYCVLRLAHLEQTQECWLGDDRDKKKSMATSTLVDRLQSRLGASAVLRVEVLPDSQPEYAVRLVPWASENAEMSRIDGFTLPPEQSRGRPARLLRKAQPIDVTSIIPEGPPIRMVWQGEDRRVVRSWGPERIATGWWRAQDVERDYYRAEWEDGIHVWVYRDQKSSCWFLHGFFD